MSIIRIQVTWDDRSGSDASGNLVQVSTPVFWSKWGKLETSLPAPWLNTSQTKERPLPGSEGVYMMHSTAWLSHALCAHPSDNCQHSPYHTAIMLLNLLQNLKLDAWLCIQDPPLCLPGFSLQACSSTVQNALFLEKVRTNFEFQLHDSVNCLSSCN